MAIHTGVNLLNAYNEFIRDRWEPLVVVETQRQMETDTTRIAYQTPDGQIHVTPGFASLKAADKWFEAILALEQ